MSYNTRQTRGAPATPPRDGAAGVGAKQLHTRNHKSEIYIYIYIYVYTSPSENTSESPFGNVQRKSAGKVTILLKIPLTSEITLENAAESPLENATGNPR